MTLIREIISHCDKRNTEVNQEVTHGLQFFPLWFTWHDSYNSPCPCSSLHQTCLIMTVTYFIFSERRDALSVLRASCAPPFSPSSKVCHSSSVLLVSVRLHVSLPPLSHLFRHLSRPEPRLPNPSGRNRVWRQVSKSRISGTGFAVVTERHEREASLLQTAALETYYDKNVLFVISFFLVVLLVEEWLSLLIWVTIDHTILELWRAHSGKWKYRTSVIRQPCIQANQCVERRAATS